MVGLFLCFSFLIKIEVPIQFISKAVEIGSATVSVAITMLGLLIASLAILASIPENSMLKKMKHYGQYVNLLLTIGMNVFLFLILACVGSYMMLGFTLCNSFFLLVLCIFGGSFYTFISLCYKFAIIFYYLSKPTKKKDSAG